jgi:hypothetical protein
VLGALLFSSLEFLVLFLPVTLAVAVRLHGQPLLRWIALTSIVFYAFAGHAWFVVPMLVTTVVDFWMAILIEREARPARRRWLLAVSLAGNLGMLAYFKYSGLLARTAEQALVALGVARPAGGFHWLEVALPAGISFYTFQTLSYIIDVWRGQAPAERNFVRFAGFVSFFPHLVAGPLTRHHQAAVAGPAPPRRRHRGLSPALPPGGLGGGDREPGALEGLAATDAFLVRTAAAVGAPMVDLSDPARGPCAAEEFLDGSHARRSCLERLLARLVPRARP